MKTKNTILLIIAFAFICSAAKAGEYHDDDKTALRNFLIQNSAETGKANGQQLGCDIDDLVRLQSDNWQFYGDAWVSKVKGLTWNEENPKRITEIEWDSIYGGLAGNLDVSGCTALTYLDCSNVLQQHRLTNLNVSGCTALTYLNCSRNYQLASLDVSKNVALTYLSCASNQLANLDVSKNIKLEELDCSINQLKSLDISNNTTLKKLSCYSNQLKSLDVSNNVVLTYLRCSGNQLTNLDVSKCASLSELNCYSNQLKSLDASGCIALTTLDCYFNQLTNLNVSGCTALTKLFCYDSQLTILDVSDCIALSKLSCVGNQLTSLDISGCAALSELSCSFNQLTSLDVSGCTALSKLNCEYNQLTRLDVTNNTALKELYCYYNQFKFSTLPLPKEQYYNYIYSSQYPIYGDSTAYSSGIDLSSEYEIAENITDFTWYDFTNGTLTPITLAGNNGIFSLDASYSGKTLICKMTNETFPKFKYIENTDYSPLTYRVTITGDDSIDDNYENLFINLYPNPSNDILTISNIDNKIFKNISLFDMAGKLLAKYSNIDNSIYSVDISQYPSGTYILNIDGKTVRFVKK